MSELPDHVLRELIQRKGLVTCIKDLDTQLQPASFDVRLAPELRVLRSSDARDLAAPRALYPDPESALPQDNLELPWEVREPDPQRNGGLLLAPGEFALASTVEVVNLPGDILARVEGKSTPARCGLIVHATAGFIDPGFCGAITLELCNLSPFAIVLYPGDLIAQLAFAQLAEPCEDPYDGKYQGQDSVGLPQRR